mmetsp:Transcript_95848/g.240199  ORF Transcript_95848/g.240199 Transcript_95848/m.240199 type:complete len:228 (-) Transcript_95848:132-815(-)
MRQRRSSSPPLVIAVADRPHCPLGALLPRPMRRPCQVVATAVLPTLCRAVAPARHRPAMAAATVGRQRPPCSGASHPGCSGHPLCPGRRPLLLQRLPPPSLLPLLLLPLPPLLMPPRQRMAAEATGAAAVRLQRSTQHVPPPPLPTAATGAVLVALQQSGVKCPPCSRRLKHSPQRAPLPLPAAAAAVVPLACLVEVEQPLVAVCSEVLLPAAAAAAAAASITARRS